MKKKQILLLSISLWFFNCVYSQQIDYNADAIKLIPEESFLSNADWNTLFFDKSKKNVPSKVGINKQVRIAPDESVFISDRSNFTITKLDKTGKHIKTFGKQGWNEGEFANNQDFNGILNNKLLVISDNQGRINFFDLNCNFAKMITLDFMPLRIIPTNSNKLIIYGHVPYNGKTKYIIANLDYETGEYEQIYYTFRSHDDPKTGFSIPYKGNILRIGHPYASHNKMLQVTNDNKIIFSINSSNIVKVFSKITGKYKESEFNIKTNPPPITEKEKEEYYLNFKEKLSKKGIDLSYAEKIKEKGFFPEHLPYYYNLFVDNDNNTLFFIYSNDNKDHLFQAYSIDGNFLGESEFIIDGYDLVSKPNHITTKNGSVYIYTLALKHNEDNPLRILKCKIKYE